MGARGRNSLPYSSGNFRRTRFRQDHPPGVLRFLVPKPFVSVELTGPSVYRTVDREHPTLIIDEADDLFYRKSDLRAIVNAGWSSWHEDSGGRGVGTIRSCPKILGILGKTKLPRAIASRSIILRMRGPKSPMRKLTGFCVR